MEYDILKQFKVELVITLNKLYTLFGVGYLATIVFVIDSPMWMWKVASYGILGKISKVFNILGYKHMVEKCWF